MSNFLPHQLLGKLWLDERKSKAPVANIVIHDHAKRGLTDLHRFENLITLFKPLLAQISDTSLILVY
jgi:hypothetical protein